MPAGVRAGMRRHGVARTSIFLGALRPRAKTLTADVPPGALVTLETHDMVPLAGFLQGDDIETRVETGQLDPRRRAARSPSAAASWPVLPISSGLRRTIQNAQRTILAGCLAYLARSAAKIVLVNLEDLLLERRPQNVPGTSGEQANWRRKLAVSLEDLPPRP